MGWQGHGGISGSRWHQRDVTFLFLQLCISKTLSLCIPKIPFSSKRNINHVFAQSKGARSIAMCLSIPNPAGSGESGFSSLPCQWTTDKCHLLREGLSSVRGCWIFSGNRNLCVAGAVQVLSCLSQRWVLHPPHGDLICLCFLFQPETDLSQLIFSWGKPYSGFWKCMFLKNIGFSVPKHWFSKFLLLWLRYSGLGLLKKIDAEKGEGKKSVSEPGSLFQPRWCFSGMRVCALAQVYFWGCDGHYWFFSTQGILKIYPCLAGHWWHGSAWVEEL